MAPRSKPTCDLALAALALIAAPGLALAGGAVKPAQKPTPAPAASPDDLAKREAQALVTDGVKLLQSKQYAPALEKFLAAYDRFPSPKILLNVGSTLRDMGRLADAANTYERYLEDPRTGAERVAEVKQLLNDLDQKVALLVVELTPPGADVSIDGGPWTTIGASLSTRIEVGPHMVRARKAGLEQAEVPVTGFEGQRKNLSIALKLENAGDVAATPPTTTTTTRPATGPTTTAPPTTGNTAGWLITGPHAGRGHARQGHSGTGAVAGEVHVATVGPSIEHLDDHVSAAPSSPTIGSRIEGSLQTRIDGKLRGAALAVGAAYDPSDELQLEAAMLLSKDRDGVIYGAYVGARMHFLDGPLRLLVGTGVPLFWSGGSARVGARLGSGAELLVNEHLSVLADVGVEHFFNTQAGYEATVVVPILGVHGRM